MKCEAGIGREESSAAFLWDLMSFFDMIDHDLLRKRAQEEGFPTIILEMIMSAYVAPRTVQIREGRAAPIFPHRGVTAGCTFAKALIHLYYMRPIDKILEDNPGCDLDVYIDDITVIVTGKDNQQILTRCAKIAGELRVMIKDELRCEVADEKEAVVASSVDLAEQVMRTIGANSRATNLEWAPNLGVDFAAGRKRGTRTKNTVRHKRLAKGKKRKKRLQTLRKLLGPRIAGHIFGAGVLPSIAYGAEVNGVSDDEWATLQRIGAAAHSSGT